MQAWKTHVSSLTISQFHWSRSCHNSRSSRMSMPFSLSSHLLPQCTPYCSFMHQDIRIAFLCTCPPSLSQDGAVYWENKRILFPELDLLHWSINYSGRIFLDFRDYSEASQFAGLAVIYTHWEHQILNALNTAILRGLRELGNALAIRMPSETVFGTGPAPPPLFRVPLAPSLFPSPSFYILIILKLRTAV